MKFRRLTIDDKALFETYLTDAQPPIWEYNFFTVFTWDFEDKRRLWHNEDFLLVYAVYQGKCVFLPPYLKHPGAFIPAIETIENNCPCPHREVRIRGLSREQADTLALRGYEITVSRDDSDYIYLSDDLKYLRGKPFHAKRNFVNRFTEAYAFEFREYEDGDFPSFLALFDRWQEESPHETLLQERAAIIRALENRAALELKIGVMVIDGAVRGYSLSAFNPDGAVHTGFEKADTAYRGIYQALNQMAAQRFFADGVLVNRQEDMGIEGLRRAKESYNPVRLLEKYKARRVLT
ncbi:MAG: phosphatidylglycerol lysyltransferase domain-containing protein [Clostridiales bacterium]|jgi:hypothetical protein|nr:phosphatidylglycerol lysyltransferase domain-containing protein [Clostridiales bacterium]